MDQEKIFANNVTNKGLISRIYKQLIQPKNNSIKKWAADLDFPQRKDKDGQ